MRPHAVAGRFPEGSKTALPAYRGRMRGGDPFVEYLLELLAPLGEATARRMFGGWGVYLDGDMIGLVAGEALHLKTDAHTREAFAAAGGAAFVYRSRGRTVPTSYWSPPEAALDSADAMRPWALLALEAARRKAVAGPRGKKARPRAG